MTAITGTHTGSFVYDGAGRCVERTIDGATTVFTYDQWTPVAEWDQNNNLIATNVYGLGSDEILYRSAGSTQLFYKNDPMGNVMFLLNSAGAGVEKYKYDAFGAPTITDWSGNSRTSSAYGNRFMFSGRDYLQSFGVYDMRNRVYDPNTGHFHQTDPIGFAGDPYNLYRFAGNNPALGGDPMGLNPWDISGSDDGSDDSESPPSDQSITLELNVYNGRDYAYGIGYGPYDAYIDAIFGAQPDNSIASWQADITFAGGLPAASGTPVFGFVLSPIGAWKPQGKFTVSATPSGRSGSVFDITYAGPSGMSYRLESDIRGTLVPIFKDGHYAGRGSRETFDYDYSPNGKASFQKQDSFTNGVHARDEAILLNLDGNWPGHAIAVPRAMTQFEPFYMELEARAYGKGKDDGAELLMGMVYIRADYSQDRPPQYSPNIDGRAHPAVAPRADSRFHQ